jgi:hypothetical protein
MDRVDRTEKKSREGESHDDPADNVLRVKKKQKHFQEPKA